MGGALAGALFVLFFLYSAIIAPINERGGKAVIRKPEVEAPIQPEPEPMPITTGRVRQSTRQRIIARVPEYHPLFLKAAKRAMETEEECRTVKDTSPEIFAWGLVGHWRKENGMCLGTPVERCAVSSTGARGPMQFMTTNRSRDKHGNLRFDATWDVWGRDGDGDGKKDVETLADSAFAAAAYLCHLRKVEGSWGHAMCRYYGDDVKTCEYEQKVRKQIAEIKRVLVEEAERQRLEAEAAKNPQNKKLSRTLSKAKSIKSVQ